MLPPLYPPLVRGVIYPVYRGLRGDRLISALEELEKNQWLSSRDLEEMQWRRLESLLSQIEIHVPYYRDLFRRAGVKPDDIQSPADLRRLPLLTKDMIREAGALIVSKDPLRRGDASSTEDATGESLAFYVDASAGPIRRANTMRGYRRAGIDIGDRQAFLWGVHPDVPRRERLVSAVWNYFLNYRYLSTFDMSDATMLRYAAQLRVFRPQLVTAYPSALALFARFCAGRGITDIRPRAIISTGEQLFEDQREAIETAFGCRVFNRYGSEEFGAVAHECPAHAGLHVMSDLVYVEILAETGEPAKAGEVGELVVTDLLNYYMPFVRYRTGDLAVATEKACPCGSGFPLLERIEERSIDAIVTPDGKRVGEPSGKSRFTVSNTGGRLLAKSKIHRATITGEVLGRPDCVVIDGEIMDRADIAQGEQVLIVDITNGERIETFAVRGSRGSGEIVACGSAALHVRAGDKVGIMAFTWTEGSAERFSNILVDERNRFVRYLTELHGDTV
jgi:phenylacetate-CoA ligase